MSLTTVLWERRGLCVLQFMYSVSERINKKRRRQWVPFGGSCQAIPLSEHAMHNRDSARGLLRVGVEQKSKSPGQSGVLGEADRQEEEEMQEGKKRQERQEEKRRARGKRDERQRGQAMPGWRF